MESTVRLLNKNRKALKELSKQLLCFQLFNKEDTTVEALKLETPVSAVLHSQRS